MNKDSTNKPLQFSNGRGGSAIRSLSQSLEFHDSPQSFLGNIDGQTNPPNFVRAKILNRNVIVVSSYKHCREILENNLSEGSYPESVTDGNGNPPSSGTFTACPAYRELMADFFPPPNLLLLEGEDHREAKLKWRTHMMNVSTRIPSLVRECMERHLSKWANDTTIDLYEDMKELSWEILYAIFLDQPGTQTQDYTDFVTLQEKLLRGQFSLFPVSVRVPFWRSARSKGLNARSKLQKLLHKEASSLDPTCPFAQGGENLDTSTRAANLLLFTSSLAAKSLASLLTASLLNLFLFPYGQSSLSTEIRSLDHEQKESLLHSVLLETERLSPPVIGVMRRVEKEVCLRKEDATDSIFVPAGWDVWMYFAGAARDEMMFPEANKFIPERYLTPSQAEPGFAFGAGYKECLGKDLVRRLAHETAATVIEQGWDLEGSVKEAGVQGWLGWDENVSLEKMAEDMKQLPVQRPRKPLRVKVRKA